MSIFVNAFEISKTIWNKQTIQLNSVHNMKHVIMIIIIIMIIMTGWIYPNRYNDDIDKIV